MKRIIQYFIIPAVALSAFVACSEDNESDRTADYQEMSFTLQSDMDGLDLGWMTGNAASIFDGKANQKFITEESGAQASFRGTANRKAEAFRALYPYVAGLQRYSGKVSVSIPTSQEAVKGGMKTDYRLMAGYASAGSSAMDMKLLPAVIKFTINPGEYEVVSVQIASKGNEPLAGACKVGLFEEPTIEVAAGASPKVTVNGLNLNGTYYIAALPQSVESGFTVSITDAYDQRCEIAVPAKELKTGEITDFGTFSGFSLAEALNPNPTDVEGAVILKAGFTEGEFNIVSDSSFEDYADMPLGYRTDWKGLHGELKIVDGHTGTRGLRLDNSVPGWWMDLYTQCIGFRPETEYVYSMWGKAATPHAFHGVRLFPFGPNAERGGVNDWSDYEEDTQWVYVTKEFNTGNNYYGDVFAGLWGDAGAFLAVDDIRVIPKGYDKTSMATASVEVIGAVTNATYDEVTSAGKIVAWEKADGKIALGFSNAVINGVEYDTAIALTDGSDLSKGLVINKFFKEKGVIQPIVSPGAGEISAVPDAIFRRDGKLYLHYFTTTEERSADDWLAGKSSFVVSEDEGLTWKPAGLGYWNGAGKFAQAGFLTKDGYTYMIGSAAGRSDGYYDNFFVARAPESADPTNPANYDYWTGKEYDTEIDENGVGPEAILSVGDKSEPALIYNPKFGRYMLIYRSNKHAGLVYRDAESPEGYWSGEKILTNDDVTGKLIAPVVLDIDADGNVILFATKQL